MSRLFSFSTSSTAPTLTMMMNSTSTLDRDEDAIATFDNFPWTDTALDDEAYQQSMSEDLGDDGCLDSSTHSTATAKSSSKPKTHLKVGRRPKKRKGMPRRSLTAYNLFFRDVRSELIQQGGNVTFEEMGKIVGKRWQVLSEEEREKYISLAKTDAIRYQEEMKTFEENRKKENEKRAAARMDSIQYPTSTSPRIGLDAFLPNHYQFQTLPPEWIDRNIRQPDTPLPISPGTVVSIPQLNGTSQRFKVDYKFVKMKQSEAKQFIADLHLNSQNTN